MDSNKTVVWDFIEKHPFSAAKALETLDDDAVAAFFQELTITQGMRLLELMNAGKATKCFLMLSPKKKKELLEHSDAALVESLLRLMDEPNRKSLMLLLSVDKATQIKRRLEQIPNSVGVFMSPAISSSKSITVREAIQIIKGNKEYFDSVFYVVNLEGELEGMVGLKELMLADKTDTLGELMHTNIPRFLADTPIKNVLNHPAWLEYNAIAIIDKSERLLGSLPFIRTKEVAYRAARPQASELIKTGSALGELYLIGIAGLLQAVGK